jgi:1,4-dihydroxy-2-naphthoyl-CoA hydrolase
VLETDENAELTAFLRGRMPYAAGLDLRVVQITKETTVALVEWRPELTTTGGGLHGGYLMGCADAIGAVVAFYNLPEGSSGTTTIESKTNFFRAVRSGTIQVRAVPVHVGSTTIVVQTDVTDAGDRLVCRTVQTQLVLRAGANGDAP